MAEQVQTPLANSHGARYDSDGISPTTIDSQKPQIMTESSSIPNDSSPIVYLYLTFNSQIPPLVRPDDTPLPLGVKLPQCPDLRAYTSPLEWAPGRKRILLVLSCVATFLTAYTPAAYSPPAGLMAHDFETTRLAVISGITTFCVGFGFAPMALAPLSEAWGRYPIFITAGILFVVFQALSSVMPHVIGMLVCRFFVGAGASVFSAVVGGVIADLWGKEDRNTPMALFSGSVLLGASAGPLVSTLFVDGINNPTRAWKWTFWHQVIMDAILMVLISFFFKESRASVLLTRKAKLLNDWYVELESVGQFGFWLSLENFNIASSSELCLTERASSCSMDSERLENRGNPVLELHRIRWIVMADELRPALSELVTASIKRPFSLLFTEPIVFCFSLWAAFSWGVLYLSFSVVPYLDSSEMSRHVYIAMIVATGCATITGILQEQILKHPCWRSLENGGCPTDSTFWLFMRRKFPTDAPESRLYFSCITSILLPSGLFLGFLCPESWNLYTQAIGLGFTVWGIYSVYLATFNYLADTYQVYASSALAAQNLCRNILGGVFPLVAPSLFRNLGTRAAGGLLGGIAAGLTMIPWILVYFGHRIRSLSKVSLALKRT
ncbi:hypothetical protein NQ176_g2218 [Zarea fungicola]|uniref:Uncharacterized protein n=1 Tax=Zarea fungicola TaxID=93591 RepID=A0ACC1NP59_9HYPO|nr:hypothetical protein NQ176_g2218 [Lecanicillium fungicola]